ncbi:hypothetical protein FE257_010420 [Aspergillus nanangensis]|uniref:AB hydrolase-1 domain-containing protein n=1 Tax=Aspergillus nanangensis TaxID=2582783 RepID=A0AAD4CIG5_ASPNN|nr:hypothetical protein FE257_010420 [Aspergillus nanangensis]
MQQFEVSLPDGGTISGRFSFPTVAENVHLPPLIVCIPGGSYDSEYFDANETHSIFTVATGLGIPVIALNRPGYGASTLPPNMNDLSTYNQAQGRYLNSTILPTLWTEFGGKANASAIVLLSHSIGATVAIISAGSYAGSEGYPLAGIITSGIGTELSQQPRDGMVHLMSEPSEFIHFDSDVKDALMLQLPHRKLAGLDMREHTERLNKPVPRGELHDINTTWLGYWKEYSSQIGVPLLHGLAEFDGLWVSSPQILNDYKAAFTQSPHVICEQIPMAPHCIELSFQGRAWYMRCCAFATQCTISRGVSSEEE